MSISRCECFLPVKFIGVDKLNICIFIIERDPHPVVDVDPVVLVGKVALQLMPSLSLIVMGMLMTAVVMVMILATMTTTTMGHLAVDSKLVVDPLKPSGNSILNQTRQSKQCKTLVLNVVSWYLRGSPGHLKCPMCPLALKDIPITL